MKIEHKFITSGASSGCGGARARPHRLLPVDHLALRTRFGTCYGAKQGLTRGKSGGFGRRGCNGSKKPR